MGAVRGLTTTAAAAAASSLTCVVAAAAAVDSAAASPTSAAVVVVVVVAFVVVAVAAAAVVAWRSCSRRHLAPRPPVAPSGCSRRCRRPPCCWRYRPCRGRYRADPTRTCQQQRSFTAKILLGLN